MLEFYGYYLAYFDQEFGDPKLSNACRKRWEMLEHPDPSRFDGVSIFSGEFRIMAQDFFFVPSQKTKFFVASYNEKC